MQNAASITHNTLFADLLTAYPFLREKLPQINTRFRLLYSPLAKSMLQKATISEISKRSGMDEAVFIQAIEDAVESR